MQLIIDVMISVEKGSPIPVYGSHNGPESVPAMMRKSDDQKLLFWGRLGIG
jgi:hypothetical protein